MSIKAVDYQQIAIDKLSQGQYQPRQQFDEATLLELSDSIKTQGLIEPLVVRSIGGERYEIIAGERRLRAAALAGLQSVPCLIGDYSDEQAAAITLIENIQREDLNLIEEAQGYQRLIREFSYQQDDIAQLVGKSRSHIANLLRLLTLDKPIQDAIRAKTLTLGHARMLVGLSSRQQQHYLGVILDKGLSVRQLEATIKALKTTAELELNELKKSVDIMHLEEKLAEQLGAPVQIESEVSQSGWLKIKYFNNETLEGLLERLGLRYDE